MKPKSYLRKAIDLAAENMDARVSAQISSLMKAYVDVGITAQKAGVALSGLSIPLDGLQRRLEELERQQLRDTARLNVSNFVAVRVWTCPGPFDRPNQVTSIEWAQRPPTQIDVSTFMDHSKGVTKFVDGLQDPGRVHIIVVNHTNAFFEGMVDALRLGEDVLFPVPEYGADLVLILSNIHEDHPNRKLRIDGVVRRIITAD